jgi:predicted PurR-regulated permease PerM/methanogenic corrinoid protein MtbC1
MAKPDSTALTPRFILFASIGVVLAGLYFAQEVLIPLALAGLLSFLLAPLVRRLERLHLPRPAAVIVTVLLAFSLLFAVGWVAVDQIADLKNQQDTYQNNIKRELADMRKPGGILSWVHSAGAQMHEVLGTPTTEPSGLPVRVVNQDSGMSSSESSPLDLLRPIGSFLLGPVGTAFIVTVFAIFMLLQREDLRDRLIRLVGRKRITLTTQALDDAAERVSRYLLMQSIVNGSVGVVILVLLWALGRFNHIPFPAVVLWGLLATLLRFIPYIGIWLAALPPILLSLAVYGKAHVTLEVIGSYLCVELLAANVFEPLLYGSSTGIATLAVLVAAAFWTWLWGPVGLLLSTPLTVVLVVMGKYVPQLEFLTVLLAEEPALSPSDRVYQRLLALDQEEAAELVNEYAKKMRLEEVYDTVLVPVLITAEREYQQGTLEEDQLPIIRSGIRDIVDEIGDQWKTKAASGEGLAAPPDSIPRGCVVNIVCLPARSESDEVAGLMLGQLLELRGYRMTLVSVTQLASEMIESVQNAKADVVCISALPPAAVTHSRYLCKRIAGKLPEMEMLVGLWTSSGDLKRARERLAAVRSLAVACNFVQAIEQIHQMAQPKMMAVHCDK